MTLTIELPERIQTRLEKKAREEKRPPEELAADYVVEAIDNEYWETPEEVVARIKATPPNPNALRRGDGSLADALRNAPQDADFDLEQWTKDWARVEAEMKALTRANEIAEGRG